MLAPVVNMPIVSDWVRPKEGTDDPSAAPTRPLNPSTPGGEGVTRSHRVHGPTLRKIAAAATSVLIAGAFVLVGSGAANAATILGAIGDPRAVPFLTYPAAAADSEAALKTAARRAELWAAEEDAAALNAARKRRNTELDREWDEVDRRRAAEARKAAEAAEHLAAEQRRVAAEDEVRLATAWRPSSEQIDLMARTPDPFWRRILSYGLQPGDSMLWRTRVGLERWTYAGGRRIRVEAMSDGSVAGKRIVLAGREIEATEAQLLRLCQAVADDRGRPWYMRHNARFRAERDGVARRP